MALDSRAALSEPIAALCFLLILIVPFAGAGLSLINTGLNRSRNAAHGIVVSLCVFSVALLVYFVWGFALQGLSGQPSHLLNIGGREWSWMGAGPLFLRNFPFDGSTGTLVLLLQTFCVGLAAIIPGGSAAERWRLGAAFASTVLLAGCTYPLFAHWVWGGGWLARLGANYQLGNGFIDAGGASTIQAVGGITALSIAWIIGPRRGKFSSEGMPTAMPGHNAVFVLFGCILALIGWLGLNSACSLLFTATNPSQLVLVVLNTMLSAASAALAAVAVTRVRFGKPDASLSANGWVTGLVASSACCPFVKPAEAVVIGLVAGTILIFAIEIIELRMQVDDPGGAIAVHGIGGIWGILAAGIFARIPENASGSGQFLAQLIGVATLLGFVLPLTFGLNVLLHRFLPQRVAPEGERQGMDLFELGAGAYPEFVLHREDFTRR